MLWNNRYPIKTQKDIENDYGEITCENQIINNIDVLIIGHYGNCTSLIMDCESCSPLGLRVNTRNLGYIISTLVDLFDKTEDSGIYLRDLKGTPLRVIYSKVDGKALAIGHFIKDQFIYIDDLMKVEWGGR